MSTITMKALDDNGNEITEVIVSRDEIRKLYDRRQREMSFAFYVTAIMGSFTLTAIDENHWKLDNSDGGAMLIGWRCLVTTSSPEEYDKKLKMVLNALQYCAQLEESNEN